MRMIYISHPYTGQKTRNVKAAEEIAASLAEKLPGIVFINPLNAFQHLKKAKIPYEDVIAQCVTLMEKCDGVIMAGNWKDSRGCNIEFDRASKLGMEIWDGVGEFEAEEIMPNDCCGRHSCCADCLCRKCEHRSECWNCNDCKADGGKAYPIGFTESKAGQYRCSRFRDKHGAERTVTEENHESV